MNEETRARDERLRAILREGDPAGSEPAPTSEEVWRMRRALRAALAPAGEPRRGAVWIPVLATAALALALLTLALGLWRVHTGSMVPSREAGRQAAETPAPIRTPAPPPTPRPAPAPVFVRPETPELPGPVPALGRSPEGRAYAPVVAPAPRAREVAPALPEPDPPALEPVQLASVFDETPIVEAIEAGEPESSLPPEEPEIRQVQFDAPAGTRVIWMLSSESIVDDTIK